MKDDLKMRVLIVDDDAATPRKIRKLLERHADVEVIGDCDNGYDAAAAIKKDAPDLVFLDVIMHEVDGFGVLDRLKESQRPLVIFVTGYAKYAMRAWDVHAVDFLSKPLARKRFDEALEKARTWMAAVRERGTTPRAAGTDYPEYLGFKSSGRIFFIPTEKIDWIAADAQYVLLHFDGKAHLLRESISKMEARLNPRKFVRIDRSYIVRLDYIREIQHLPGQRWVVVLRDSGNTELPLSKRGREKLARLLNTSL